MIQNVRLVPLQPSDRKQFVLDNQEAFFTSLLNVVCEIAPYLLLGFFIAGRICAE